MIRMPRKKTPRCACGTCRVCTDPVAANTAALRAAMAEPDEARLGGQTVTVPARVAAPWLPWLPKRPVRPAPDFDAFTGHMAALTNEIYPPRPDDVKR